MKSTKPMHVLGIMSGTSIDSVDYALCAIEDGRIELEDYWQVEYPRSLRQRLHAAARGEANSHETAQLHHDLGRFYARHARKRSRRGPSIKPVLIGLHGQTVFHHPDRKRPATFQIGEPAYLAEVSRVPVVANFRTADMAAGGQGAPLATIFHVWVFGGRGRHVCVNNLGGISNVTSIDWRRGNRPRILAFDTGPANVLLDLAMRRFTRGRLDMDRDGQWAAQGRPAQRLVAGWLKHRFFRQKPPKSTGRELFGEIFLEQTLADMAQVRLSRYDRLATLTEFTAASIALNYELHLPGPPDLTVLTGGGAANPALAEAIRHRLTKGKEAWGMEVKTSEELGWPLQSIEPAAFALLAYLRWHMRPGHIRSTTGASHEVLIGSLTSSAWPNRNRRREQRLKAE